MEDTSEILEINTSALDSVCAQYNDRLNNIELSFSNLASDFQAFLNCGVLTSYIPDLKNNIDKVVSSIDGVISSVKVFAEEQERIDKSYRYDPDSGTKKDNKENTLEILDDASISALFNSDEFLEALYSIVQENPDILSDESLCDLLKELLLKCDIKDEKILNIINENDSKALQTALYKIISGEISIIESNDMLDKIKMIVLSSLVKNDRASLQNNIEIESDIIEGGKYVNKSFTGSNGVKIDYYVYVPKNINNEEELPLHLFLWPTRSQGPGGYFNVHGLPALLRHGQDASGVVICPRLGANEKYTNSKMKAIKELMDQYVETYNLDKNRISVSGQGGGGQAAINISTKYPDYFSKVAGLYSSAATSDYSNYASSKEQAEFNVANTSILLIKSRGGGDYLNNRSENYTNKIYNKLKKYNNIDVINNPDLGDLYGASLYKKEFTYNGKTYPNFLEYMFAQTK